MLLNFEVYPKFYISLEAKTNFLQFYLLFGPILLYIAHFYYLDLTMPLPSVFLKMVLTLTKAMLDSGILTRRLIKEGLDPSWEFLSSPPCTKGMTSHLCQ